MWTEVDADMKQNLIKESYPDYNLPPLWQVIYQEATRGNHILFNDLDFDRNAKAKLDLDYITFVMSEIASCSTLRDMKNMLAIIPEAGIIQVYNYYLIYLEQLKYQLRNTLN